MYLLIWDKEKYSGSIAGMEKTDSHSVHKTQQGNECTFVFLSYIL